MLQVNSSPGIHGGAAWNLWVYQIYLIVRSFGGGVSRDIHGSPLLTRLVVAEGARAEGEVRFLKDVHNTAIFGIVVVSMNLSEWSLLLFSVFSLWDVNLCDTREMINTSKISNIIVISGAGVTYVIYKECIDDSIYHVIIVKEGII